MQISVAFLFSDYLLSRTKDLLKGTEILCIRNIKFMFVSEIDQINRQNHLLTIYIADFSNLPIYLKWVNQCDFGPPRNNCFIFATRPAHEKQLESSEKVLNTWFWLHLKTNVLILWVIRFHATINKFYLRLRLLCLPCWTNLPLTHC